MSARVDVFEGARIAFKSLRVNRMRTLLTTAGIVIGVATLLAILGIIEGLNASFARQLSSIGSNTLSIGKFKWASNEDDYFESRNRKNLTLDQMEAIRRQSSHVKAIAPTAFADVEVAFLGNRIPSVAAIGTNSEYAEVRGMQVMQGRFMTEIDDLDRKSVVVLGADIVDGLFEGMDPIGRTVLLEGHPFLVIGTLGRKGKFLGQNRDRQVYIPFKTQQAYFGKEWPMSIAVLIDSQDNMRVAEEEIVGILRRARQTPPEKPDDFVINRAEQLMDLYKKLTGALYGALAGIGLITLLVGGIGIMNIMLVSVRERTREIGVRRALGARKRTIVWQFLMEAAGVSALGGALGTTVGLSAAKLVSVITPLPAAVTASTILFGVSFSAAIGLLAGIWPAARAANLDPVEALRYE